MFITLEGGEGTGKTTQARLLSEYFISIGQKCIVTREPGGSPLAEKIRNILLADDGISDEITELLLLNAARKDHIDSFIKPKLQEGYIVICDRFIESTIVYQGHYKGVDIDLITLMHQKFLYNFKPELTFIFDIDPIISLERIANKKQTHYDKMELSIHQKIREGFLKYAQGERFVIIDASDDEKSITKNLINIIKERL